MTQHHIKLETLILAFTKILKAKKKEKGAAIVKTFLKLGAIAQNIEYHAREVGLE